jgi:uncharacterized protein
MCGIRSGDGVKSIDKKCLLLVFFEATVKKMRIEFDQAKNERNIRERGISFELTKTFEFETAIIRMDVRRSYGEPRFNAVGYIGNRLYHLTFTLRADAIRVISLRKANRREVNRYAKA